LETGIDGAAAALFVERISDQAPNFKPTTAEIAQI
jgi:hypothetical protein